METLTYAQALRQATGRLRAAGVPSPEWDARILAAHLIHTGHMEIPLQATVIPGFKAAYEPLVARREKREPLQHILGVAWFGDLELVVGPGVFIPRPETEVLADWAVRLLRGRERAASAAPAPRVVDLCTGSGALAAYVANQVATAQVWAVELSDTASTYARQNLAPHGVALVQGDATSSRTLGELDGTVDLVLTNPPYVPQTLDLEPEVYADPPEAVFGGQDGMSVIHKLIPRIATLLKPGGMVGLEHDDVTSPAVQEAMAANGNFTDIEVLYDFNRIPRFVVARRK
ncbi:SAM-dependent methyltransferase [Corynebacterium phocae]|uniref:Release factor glutamine methyltransferase n=1 Tax=Corynebacterium phocae TaxID=161895 RepID=A0A1L7D3P1_9CORY|nr:peptide chain release factor N(5)-glutamine methyltransferase [Corynebacterium phocae]APT92769.1 SAM-dependent methyltransferase [Corynebacterium phocae]KAA8723080.1 peptide chain release factor N(5)-glutamine methyltransferase [Corynebacterium phocae]